MNASRAIKAAGIYCCVACDINPGISLTLFFSDMHFGRRDYAREREKEADLLRCLHAHEDEIEHLYLLGDVFDAYIEYPRLIPKGFTRFQGLLASWSDRGLPITYLVGNHDPWHIDHFERELGVRLVKKTLTEPLYGHSVYLSHGHGLSEGFRLTRQVKSWMRHPSLGRLYAMLLPGDAGLGLARWTSERFSGKEPDPAEAEALRRHARRQLQTGPADLVVMGHSHQPVLHTWPQGRYLNTGTWAESRTFGQMNEEALRLLLWDGTRATELKTSTFS